MTDSRRVTNQMESRLKVLGAILAIIGVIAVLGGGFGYMQVQAGGNALQGFSKAENVQLSYNDQGQLVDRVGVALGGGHLGPAHDRHHRPQVYSLDQQERGGSVPGVV